MQRLCTKLTPQKPPTPPFLAACSCAGCWTHVTEGLSLCEACLAAWALRDCSAVNGWGDQDRIRNLALKLRLYSAPVFPGKSSAARTSHWLYCVSELELIMTVFGGGFEHSGLSWKQVYRQVTMLTGDCLFTCSVSLSHSSDGPADMTHCHAGQKKALPSNPRGYFPVGSVQAGILKDAGHAVEGRIPRRG